MMGKLLMFAKRSLKSFIYDLIEMFYFPQKEIPELYRKYLKLVSAIFIFSSSDRVSKTMKNVFYFILKALFVLEIFKFL